MLLPRGAEQFLAVAAAEQEDEPFQVAAAFVQALGGVADELLQGGVKAGRVLEHPVDRRAGEAEV
jgi:hypothetical protein